MVQNIVMIMVELKETWEAIAERVGKIVLKSVNAPKSLVDQTNTIY